MANELQRSQRIVINDKYKQQIKEENMDLFERYKRDLQMRELSKGTILNYESDLVQWLSYLVKEQYNINVLDVTEDDIEKFIFFCKENGNNTERIKRRMASISAFYKYLRRKKLIKENPMEFIPRAKKGLPVVKQTYLTIEQVKLMKKKLKEYGDLQLEVYALLSLSTMGRINAVSNTRWEQIDFNERTIDDVLEKEGKIVTLYFSKEVKDLLLKLKKEREKENIYCEYVFITKSENRKYDKASTSALSYWAKKIGKMINVPELHAHDFRHSGAQLLKISGMPIEDISDLLNHSGLDVTKNHYLKQDKAKMKEKKDKFEI